MGTWAIDALGNDDAADLVEALKDGDSLAVIGDALSATQDQEYLEAPEAQQALAAAEIIARLQDRPDTSVLAYEDLDAWIAANRLVIPPDLVHRAHLAIDRVLADGSELSELWQESNEFQSWLASVKNLRSRLG